MIAIYGEWSEDFTSRHSLATLFGISPDELLYIYDPINPRAKDTSLVIFSVPLEEQENIDNEQFLHLCTIHDEVIWLFHTPKNIEKALDIGGIIVNKFYARYKK